MSTPRRGQAHYCLKLQERTSLVSWSRRAQRASCFLQRLEGSCKRLLFSRDHTAVSLATVSCRHPSPTCCISRTVPSHTSNLVGDSACAGYCYLPLRALFPINITHLGTSMHARAPHKHQPERYGCLHAHFSAIFFSPRSIASLVHRLIPNSSVAPTRWLSPYSHSFRSFVTFFV